MSEIETESQKEQSVLNDISYQIFLLTNDLREIKRNMENACDKTKLLGTKVETLKGE